MNTFRNSFLLGCIAIDRKLLKKIMPIPRSVPVVSQWIGVVGAATGKLELVDIPVMYCRVNKKEAFEASFRNKSNIGLMQKLYKRIFLGN